MWPQKKLMMNRINVLVILMQYVQIRDTLSGPSRDSTSAFLHSLHHRARAARPSRFPSSLFTIFISPQLQLAHSREHTAVSIEPSSKLGQFSIRPSLHRKCRPGLTSRLTIQPNTMIKSNIEDGPRKAERVKECLARHKNNGQACLASAIPPRHKLTMIKHYSRIAQLTDAQRAAEIEEGIQ